MIASQEAQARAALQNAKRIVVKAGTRVLVGPSGRPDGRRIGALVRSIAQLKADGRQVILVSSGAIGSGMDTLGFKRRPKDVSGLQMCAAVGQTQLMSIYARLFATHGLHVGQVLLTHEDLRHRGRHLNARNTMLRLLRQGIVPIVNENDVVSVDEIRVGDNDVLAALVSLLVEAELLVLLSTTDGLKRRTNTAEERVSYVPAIDDHILGLASGKGSELSSGGMATKLRAAAMLLQDGAAVVIADGRKSSVLERVLSGKDVGTLFGLANNAGEALGSRRKWLEFFQRPSGTLIIDRGAGDALRLRGKSLLPVGVLRVDGKFEAGAVVNVADTDGEILARGLCSYSSHEMSKICGHSSEVIETILGVVNQEEAIHRDNMVLL